MGVGGVALVEDGVAEWQRLSRGRGRGRPAGPRRRVPCRRWCATRRRRPRSRQGRPPRAALVRRRASSRRVLHGGVRGCRTGRRTTAWTTVGRVARASRPSASGSTGTVRHPSTVRPSAATRPGQQLARAAALPALGRNSMKTPGTADRPTTRARAGARRPAPAATGCPRHRSRHHPQRMRPGAPGPPARQGRAAGRGPRAAPASATKPTPHASCSNRGSYSGGSAGRGRRRPGLVARPCHRSSGLRCRCRRRPRRGPRRVQPQLFLGWARPAAP